jgi:hypothetical protein
MEQAVPFFFANLLPLTHLSAGKPYEGHGIALG